jgi:hypothetical protein
LTHAFYRYAEPSPFPPSFEGDPMSYLFGLFGDVVAAGLALAILLGMLFERRRKEQVARAVGAERFMVQPGLHRFTVLEVYRAFVIGILAFIVMRAAPDAAWMLLWGEVNEPTIRLLLRLDMLLDGFALVPFFFAIICWGWGRQTIPQRLLAESALQMPRLSWGMVWQNTKIVVLVLFIAAGVTLGKAHRGDREVIAVVGASP